MAASEALASVDIQQVEPEMAAAESLSNVNIDRRR